MGPRVFWDPARIVLHWVPICDSPQAGGTGAAISPGPGAGAAYCIRRFEGDVCVL